MNTAEFDYIRQLLKKRSGLSLGEDKVYLLESRLLPIARIHNCKDLAEFIRYVRERGDERILSEVVDAMSTNESMFFRDRKPFEQLRRIILPRLRATTRHEKDSHLERGLRRRSGTVLDCDVPARGRGGAGRV